MGTKVNVNGKFQTRPGVYATIISGVKNPSPSQPYGNILIIDDGIGAGFGGGSGINGQIKQGANSVYSFDNIQDYQAFVKGGELWNLGFPLFKPAVRQNGVSKVFFISARTTTPAQLAMTLTNGAFVIKTQDEGLNGNGVLDGSNNLSLGLAGKLIQVNIPTGTATFISTTTQVQDSSHPKISTVVAANINIGDIFTIVAAGVTKTVTAVSTLAADLYNSFATLLNANSTIAAAMTATVTVNGLVLTGTANNVNFTQTSSVAAAAAQFVLQIYHGTYKGMDSGNTIPWDKVLSPDAKPTLVIQSPIFSAISDLILWFQNSPDFSNGFTLVSSTATGNAIVGDLATYPGYTLFSGGTESYSTSDFDAALAVINNLDFTHILAMNYGVNATSSNNTKLSDFIDNDSKYDRLMVVGGGYDKSSFKTGTGSSASTTAYYDDDTVVVVHGGIKKTKRGGSGFLVYNQLYKAAQILGRCAGLPSQVPVTLKSLDIDGEVHLLSDQEQEDAIKLGIMYSYYDYELTAFVAGQGITSLQKNDFLINDNGTTFNWELKRIEAELNKGIQIAGKKRFFDPNGLGGNRNTTSPEDVVSWAIGYLKDKTATPQTDNLIIRAQNVTASIDQDNLRLNYEFVGNTEISKIIMTGTIIEG